MRIFNKYFKSDIEKKYKCSSCGNLQADGDWEKAVDALGAEAKIHIKVMGEKKILFKFPLPLECCLKCGSTDLIDLWNPPTEEEQKQKAVVKSLPERAEIIHLFDLWVKFELKHSSSDPVYGYTTDMHKRCIKNLNRREQVEKKIRAAGEKLAKDGGQDLMYRVWTSLDGGNLRNIVSFCWDGISGWKHQTFTLEAKDRTSHNSV